jgi:predicted Rossmann fold nucleotide-binding protein DprA/Smf involved in DNA uptake
MTYLESPHPHYPPRLEDSYKRLTVLGNVELLNQELLGLFVSRQCPASLILQSHEWAQQAKAKKLAVVAGFQSPVEQEILRVLLKGGGNIVICPARSLETFRVSKELKAALEAKRVVLVSPFASSQKRVDKELALRRNKFVAELATTLLIIYAAPGSTTEALAVSFISKKPVFTLDAPENKGLLEAGCKTF